MSNQNLFQQASDPGQYDLLDIDWKQEANLQSPHRLFFWEYLSAYQKQWENKKVLDVGAGSGWLLHELLKGNVQSALGIEPSKNNCALAQQLFPEVTIYNNSLENFTSAEKFDVIIAVMVFPHIANTHEAFLKLARLINTSGDVYITVPNFEYYSTTTSKASRKVVGKEKKSADEYAIAIERDFGKIVDIVRKCEIYIDAAKQAGFELVEVLPMKPTRQLIESVARYKEVEHQAITDLLHFRYTPV